MPKIFGLNLIGLLATSVAFFLLGYLWYGVFFMEKWMTLMGMDASAGGEPDMMLMGLGFVNTLVAALGIGLLLKWLNVSKLVTAIKYGLIAGLCFALTTEAYGPIYGGSPVELFYLNGAYHLVGYAMVAAIWSFFD